MKSRTKKRIFKGTAAVLACAAAVGIFLQTTAVSVQAATNSMPGIDIIVNGNSSEKPFRILELVDNSDNAEIGYYISGQEPSVKLYTYTDNNGNKIHFSTLEEGLSQLPEKERKEFAMNVKVNDDGTINETDSTGISKIEMKEAAEDTAPLSYKTYQEKYFLDNSDSEEDWKKVDFKDTDGSSRADSVQANGSYVENQAGTGDYTKEEQQYYPIRRNVQADSDQPELFYENIENFSYSEDEDVRGAYFLKFAEVSNDEVNKAFSSDDQSEAEDAQKKIQSEYDYQNGRYGYYENVYSDLTEDIVNHSNASQYTFPGENPDDSVLTDNRAVKLYDNQETSASGDNRKAIGKIKNPETAGTQANPYIYLGDNIDEYPYYQYKLLGDLEYVQEKANETHEDSYEVGDIIMEDGQYWYMDEDPNSQSTLIQTELSIVTGRQPVAYEDIAQIPSDFEYNYYYSVDQVWFCSELSDGGSETEPSAYQFFGWYYPIYPSGEDTYLPISDGKVPTYYISEAQYTLTPGKGDYDFVPGGDETQTVEVDHMYYQGGYENHDWLKKYVFHLEKNEYDGFTIQVDTRYADDVTRPVHANVDESDETAVDDTDVTSYDLIYVNGRISEDTAASIANAGIPCIINMNHADGTAIQSAFASAIKANDGDGNYVTKKVYFFKGSGTSGQTLVNNDFARTFRGTQAEGFEEITKYIEQENQYRELGEDGTKLDPLSLDLSQARAVEYIINYQYKRNANLKDEINVLEIMPSVNCNQLTKDNVLNWLNNSGRIAKIDVCCYQAKNNSGKSEGPENISDNNKNTFWHSQWDNAAHSGSEHYMTITFSKSEDIKGFVYTPRQGTDNGSQNGVLLKYEAHLMDANGNEIKTISGNTNYTRDAHSQDTKVEFDTVESVKSIKLVFKSALSTSSTQYASCAGFNVLYADGSNDEQKVTITTMTASEFVGHIDDLASKYDMIYIGDNKLSSSDPAITGSGSLCYTHVGEGKLIGLGTEQETRYPETRGQVKSKSDELLKLLGQLDTEYVLNADGTRAQDSDGKYRFAPIATYQDKQSGGFFRGSGNDITSELCEEMLNFVKSGYPVVVGSSIISDGTVNPSIVDNSSYYYEFLSKAKEYNNFATVSDLNKGSKDLHFFANLAKPVITFNEKPKEPQRAGEAADANTGYIDGELRYKFSIKNDADAAPATTTYDCKLYLDLNFDGNLSEKEEQSKYIVIADEDGKIVTQTADEDGNDHYELVAGKVYTLTRKIPSDYYKIITWKLEVSSNQNNYIHTSEVGYAKQKKTDSIAKQKIKVLQLIPWRKNKNGGTWNLLNGSNFQKMIGEIDDFEIEIKTITINEINSWEDPSKMEELLSDKQMLVIGFDDTYQDISDKAGQVTAILNFIKKGKSVIFAHDTTSYVNYNRSEMHTTIALNNYNESGSPHIYYDDWLQDTIANPTWGLSLNTILRSIVGMDRYGITSDEKISSNSGEITVSKLLKKGKALADGDSISFDELMKVAGDIAYATGENRKTSYAQTQSYTNNLVNSQKMGTGSSVVTTVTKVNDGAITQYPYRMADSIKVAETHGQYYQLALEQDKDINGNSDGKSDVVVWYCLSGNLYNNSPNDVRNNYYFYSKGNVIYTGAGHSNVEKGNNADNIDEIKLFINAMVAAANVTAVDPEVNFVDELDPTADVEATRYYATDQSSWTDDAEKNVLEDSMDFYVNIKDYNMVSADLNQEDVDKQEMTLQFYIDSDKGKHVNGAPGSSKMTDITNVIGSLTDYDGKTVNVGDYGSFHLKENNAFKLTLSNPEQYLRTAGSATSGDKNGYRKDCKLYVKVTSTVYLYGEPKTSTQWASIDLKQRQLFELN